MPQHISAYQAFAHATKDTILPTGAFDDFTKHVVEFFVLLNDDDTSNCHLFGSIHSISRPNLVPAPVQGVNLFELCLGVMTPKAKVFD